MLAVASCCHVCFIVKTVSLVIVLAAELILHVNCCFFMYTLIMRSDFRRRLDKLLLEYRQLTIFCCDVKRRARFVVTVSNGCAKLQQYFQRSDRVVPCSVMYRRLFLAFGFTMDISYEQKIKKWKQDLSKIQNLTVMKSVQISCINCSVIYVHHDWKPYSLVHRYAVSATHQ